MRKKLRFLASTFAVAGVLFVAAPIHEAYAAATVENLSNALPAGEGTGYGTLGANESQVQAESGEAYVTWYEATGENGAEDAYVYDREADVITNLSSLLPATDSVGGVSFIAAETFSDGNVLVAWWEADSGGEYQLYIYDGRTDTIVDTEPLMGAQPAGGGGGVLPMVEVAADDTYYVGYESAGSRGQDDIFLYRSDLGTVTHIQALMPGGHGGGTALTVANDLKVKPNGDVALVFRERAATADRDLFLYDSTLGTVVNMSALRAGGATGTPEAYQLEFKADSSAVVLWGEAIGTDIGMPYLYDQDTGLVTGLMSLYGPGGYNRGDIYDTDWQTFGLGISPTDTIYAAWVARTTVGLKYDAFMYDGGSASVVNLTSKLPVGDGTENAGYTSVGFTAAGTALVHFEEATLTEQNIYRYDLAADTVAELATQYGINNLYPIERPNAPPHLVWYGEVTNVSGLQMRIFDASDQSVTNMSAVAGGGVIPSANINFPYALIADEPMLAIQMVVGGQQDLYLYDGRDKSVVSLRPLMSGEGAGNVDYAALAVDDDENITLAWGEDTGARGGYDIYLYSDLAAAAPPPTPTPTPSPTPSVTTMPAAATTTLANTGQPAWFWLAGGTAGVAAGSLIVRKALRANTRYVR